MTTSSAAQHKIIQKMADNKVDVNNPEFLLHPIICCTFRTEVNKGKKIGAVKFLEGKLFSFKKTEKNHYVRILIVILQ